MATGPMGVGPVNLSPKGDARLNVLDPHTIAYLDYTGSGNETARHIQAGGAVTVMVCSFEAGNAGVVRFYGRGRVWSLDEYPRAGELTADAAGAIALPPRQVIEITVESTITSCGYGVPVSAGFTPRDRFQRGRAYKKQP